jgi:hypothetical protein
VQCKTESLFQPIQAIGRVQTPLSPSKIKCKHRNGIIQPFSLPFIREWSKIKKSRLSTVKWIFRCRLTEHTI